jgi:hypothetical protein
MAGSTNEAVVVVTALAPDGPGVLTDKGVVQQGTHGAVPGIKSMLVFCHLEH